VAAGGAQYAAYGLVLMLFLAEPHVVAGLSGGGLQDFITFEVSFGLSLVPLALAAVLLEKLLYGFWDFIRRTEHTLDPTQFGIVTGHLFWWTLLSFCGALASASLIGGVVYAVLARHSAFFAQVDFTILAVGLVGFWLFGCAQFLSLF